MSLFYSTAHYLLMVDTYYRGDHIAGAPEETDKDRSN